MREEEALSSLADLGMGYTDSPKAGCLGSPRFPDLKAGAEEASTG